MGNDCTTKHPLRHGGTGRPERLNPVLDPGYVKPDERKKADYLLFLRSFSKEIAHYNLSDVPRGSWLQFFEHDDFILLALIGVRNLTIDRKTIGTLTDAVRVSNTPNRVAEGFRSLFELGFYLIHEADLWFKKTVPGTPVHLFLEQIIKTIYSPHAANLVSLYKGAITDPELFDAAEERVGAKENRITWEEFRNLSPAQVWYPEGADQTAEAPWKELLNSIAPETEAYGPDRFTTGTSAAVLMRRAVSSLNTILTEVLNAIRYMQRELPSVIEKSLESHSQHEPHIGLILSFLDQFEYARKELNTLTARHLDFYYKDVLGLRHKPPVPDRVHLIGEPARHVEQVHVKKNTLLKAGKDAEGKDLFYSTEEESVINHAEITELRSVEITNQGIYAAPAVRMADGIEEEYEDEKEGWHPFRVHDKKIFTEALRAEVGFAISSGLLSLSEGDRTITINITGSGLNLLDIDVEKAFRVLVTGNEGWMEISVTNIEVGSNKLKVTAKADFGEPPITEFDQDVHDGGYNAGFPVLKVVLNQAEVPEIYQHVKNFQIHKVGIKVDVKGVKTLIAETPPGKMDTTRSFQPFGHAPAAGNLFLVGSAEIFSKPLQTLKINLGWQEHPEDNLSDYYNWTGFNLNNSDFGVTIDVLKKGEWVSAGDSDLFSSKLSDKKTLIVEESVFNDFEPNQSKTFKRFSHDLKTGFVRIKLNGPDTLFGHKKYPGYLAEYIKDQSPDPETEMPVEPFTPEIASLSADYTAKTDIEPGESHSDVHTRLFHIHPFGIYDVAGPFSMSHSKTYLLPRYQQPGETVSQPFTGLMLAGISKFNAPGTISMLVKVKDGTADPETTAASVAWYYLSKTGWQQLKKDQSLKDTTNHFQHQGLVTIDIPSDARPDNRLAGGEEPLIWIMAATSGSVNSIPELLGLHTQAFTATLTDTDNDLEFSGSPLPSESISKLLNPDPGIKSIHQPYASFNGKPAESSQNFYQRVSERLRHKNRGNSLWDYERLILEAFPDLYRVKCISHSAYAFEKEDGDILNAEFAPGYVSVLVVPDLQNRTHMDPLQPRVSLGRLEDIRHFLETRISPFAAEKLSVLNPLFETIKAELYAEFTAGTDEMFNRKRLNEEIVKFLSPWAFGQADAFRFGDKVYKSDILNFVKNLPFVENVIDFKMYHKTGTEPSKEVSMATASTARSVLTSAASHDLLEASSC